MSGRADPAWRAGMLSGSDFNDTTFKIDVLDLPRLTAQHKAGGPAQVLIAHHRQQEPLLDSS
jgi:hypothetical protein